ncbi:MAG: ASKHA domain-containing protein [Oscillospiraceae bacterium]
MKSIKISTKDKNILLSALLEQNNIKINKPCGSNGTCGKCKVHAIGEMSPVTDAEKALLTQYELDNNIRLACLTYVHGDICVYYNTDLGDVQGITHGYMPDFKADLNEKDGYGMAVDIGTTTIAAYLYKFPENTYVTNVCVPNPQAEFGADVISRIEYSNNGGLEKLTDSIVNVLSKIADKKDITRSVITGNTTMLHLLTGLNPRTIAVSPFEPKSLFGEWHGKTYLPRCISAYVGGDITTAILASDMLNTKTSFLVDIGTNGEMALWHNGELVCCSTAAGPAFEGAGISMGTLAISGAINKVYIDEDKIKYTTIDNEKPIGICGTGLIDAIACMVSSGILEESGYLEESFKIGDSGISISSSDVREVQLAKSAIRAGIDTLLDSCKISYDDIENFYIAGGFGSYIDKNSAAEIGLIPTEILDKVKIMGNGAGSGAIMILLSNANLSESERIAKMAQTIELSNSPIFMEKYIDAMMF